MVTRNLTRLWAAQVWVVDPMGALVLLPGVLHVVVGFRVGRQVLRGRTILSTLLGVLEIIRGGLLLLTETGRNRLTHTAAPHCWGTALYQHIQARLQAPG
jgi:hypothetical protein